MRVLLESEVYCLEERVHAATAIVRAASIVAKKAQNELLQENIVNKSDLSPVTVIDYAVQASIVIFLKQQFPNETFRMIAEEDSMFINQKSSTAYLSCVTDYVNQILFPQTVTPTDVVCSLSDCHYSGDIHHNYWLLDPIDGTKGFIRHAQFAVGLAYVESGIPVIGVVGCPNLLFDIADVSNVNWNSNIDGIGCIAVGMHGHGSTLYDLFSEKSRLLVLHNSPYDDGKPIKVVISHQSINHTSTLQNLIDINQCIKDILEIDSMCKYIMVAIGIVDFYIRENKNAEYRENVWDHAAGLVVLEEAGGIVSDLHGVKLSFAHGSKLCDNIGILASSSTHLQDNLLRELTVLL